MQLQHLTLGRTRKFIPSPWYKEGGWADWSPPQNFWYGAVFRNDFAVSGKQNDKIVTKQIHDRKTLHWKGWNIRTKQIAFWKRYFLFFLGPAALFALQRGVFVPFIKLSNCKRSFMSNGEHQGSCLQSNSYSCYALYQKFLSIHKT